MADFEDATLADLGKLIEGQSTCATPSGAPSSSPAGRGKRYPLGDSDRDARGPAARLAPARERICAVDGQPMPAPVRLRAVLLPQRQRADRAAPGPYFYLPKLESHLEARLWNDVFVVAQERLGMPAAAPSRRRC